MVFLFELGGDLGVAEVELGAEEIHSDLAGFEDVLGANFAGDFFDGEVVKVGDFFGDDFG